MATTTPNYGWTVPTSTDLVKDGATAIETLGDAIDASMNTALGTKKAGIVLLNTTSFSAVASQSINDVFSTTYDNYKFIINATSSGNAAIQLRYRVAGADNSTASSYISQAIYADNTPVASGRLTSDKATLGDFATTFKNTISGEIFDPFLTVPTRIQTFNNWSLNNASWQSYMGFHNQSTSYTGFTIYPASGTITGSISVFAYAK
jgi:hypothetical protein